MRTALTAESRPLNGCLLQSGTDGGLTAAPAQTNRWAILICSDWMHLMTDSNIKPLPPPHKVRHDEVFRALLEDTGRAATLIRETLPSNLAARMTDTPPRLVDATFIDEQSRMTQSDRLFEIELEGNTPALVYTLLEHKSAPDAGTPLQLLGYMVRIWKRYAGGKADRLRALPPIIPMVYYHGAAAWHIPDAFADMVQADDDTKPFVPEFRYLLRDLGEGPVETLSSDKVVRAVLTALRFALRADEAGTDILKTILSGIENNQQVLIHVVLRYIVERYEITQPEVQAALTATNTDGENLMSSLADIWMEQGEARGEARGKALGIEEGEARGKAHTLARLVRLKFGPFNQSIQKRIDQADVAQLDQWTDLVLVATTLEDIFGVVQH